MLKGQLILDHQFLFSSALKIPIKVLCNIVNKDSLAVMPPQYLADQLTLFQPGGGADSALPLLLAPPIFSPSGIIVLKQ